jgi:membrane protein required for colicin V production
LINNCPAVDRLISMKVPMNVLDYILLSVFGYCLGRGVFRGLVKELSSIIGVIGGFYAAYTYYPQLGKMLSGWFTNPGYLNILSFLMLFVGIYLAVSITGVIIKHLMNIAFLGWTDWVCGAFFGAVKGLLIITILVLMLTAFLPKNAVILQRSHVSKYMMQFSTAFVKVVPKDMKNGFRIKMKELSKSWQAR